MATSIIGTQQRAYGVGQGLQPIPPFTIVAQRAPTTSDRANIGTFWIFTTSNDCYVLVSINNGISNWVSFNQGGTGQFSSLDISTGPNTIAGLTTFNGNVVFNGNITQTAGVTSLLQTTITGSLSQNGGATLLNTDAIAQTINIGTGAAAKTVTLGSTNTTSTTTINSGSGNITMNGTVLKPSQPMFFAYASADQAPSTGDGTQVQINFPNVDFNVGGSYSGGVFTAPVSGKYLFGAAIMVGAIAAPMNRLDFNLTVSGAGTGQSVQICNLNPTPIAQAGFYATTGTYMTEMTAGQTINVRFTIFGLPPATPTAFLVGNAGAERRSYFYGQLVA